MPPLHFSARTTLLYSKRPDTFEYRLFAPLNFLFAQYFIARRIEQIGTRDMGITLRLTLTATQAVFDIFIQRTQLAFFQNQCFLLHQSQ